MDKPKIEISRKRHIAKTITWRILASTDTLLIGWVLTGSLKIGSSIAGVEIITKMALYYAHERVWYQSNFGILSNSFVRRLNFKKITS